MITAMILLLHHPPHPSDVHSASGLHEGLGPFQPHKVGGQPLLGVSHLARARASVVLSLGSVTGAPFSDRPLFCFVEADGAEEEEGLCTMCVAGLWWRWS